jgi:hypothetical protein
MFKWDWDKCAHLHFVTSRSTPRRGHGHHDHANANVSVLQRSHENENEIACAVGHGHGGVRVLHLHPLAVSFSRRCLRFHFRVSAAASSLPSRGICVVANERRERCANTAEES